MTIPKLVNFPSSWSFRNFILLGHRFLASRRDLHFVLVACLIFSQSRPVMLSLMSRDYPGFHSMKRQGVLLLLLDWMLVHHR